MAGPFYAPGRYICEMTDQGLSTASTGTPQIVWRFLVLETDRREQVPAQYERTIYRAVTERTMPYVLDDLRTLGFRGDSFKELDPNNPDHQSFKGVQFVAFCNHEEGQDGKTREKWGIVNEGSFEIKPMESKKVRELDALFGKELKKLKADTATTERRPAPVGAQQDEFGITDDDVPF